MKRVYSLAFLVSLASPVVAQESNWEYSATMYGWLTSLSSTVGTPIGNVKTDADFSDVLDSLDMAFMGTFEARNNRWSLIGDLIYSDLSSKNGTPGPVFTSAEVETSMTLLSGYAAYSVLESADAKVDIAGGLRWYDVDIGVGLTGGPVPGNSSLGDSWVDPVVAARLTVPLSENWFAMGLIDVGGFGIGEASDLSWQVLASFGYNFSDTWSARFGYRYLSIEKEFGGSDVNLELYGPIIGITARF